MTLVFVIGSFTILGVVLRPSERVCIIGILVELWKHAWHNYLDGGHSTGYILD